MDDEQERPIDRLLVREKAVTRQPDLGGGECHLLLYKHQWNARFAFTQNFHIFTRENNMLSLLWLTIIYGFRSGAFVKVDTISEWWRNYPTGIWILSICSIQSTTILKADLLTCPKMMLTSLLLKRERKYEEKGYEWPQHCSKISSQGLERRERIRKNPTGGAERIP